MTRFDSGESYSELTKVQKKVYNLCINRRQYAYPSYQTIADYMGWKSKSYAWRVVKLLKKKGLL